MVTWGELAEARPDLAEAGRGRLYQFGVGLAFLATVRRDGGPRVHPMCPVLDGAGLYAFLVPSPKREDLLRDGRYSLHSFPAPDNEDAFYVAGTAHAVDDGDIRARLARQFVDERAQIPIDEHELDGQTLFELGIDTVLSTVTTGHGDPHPQHTIWHA